MAKGMDLEHGKTVAQHYIESQKADPMNERGFDLYETPWQATRALIKEIQLSKSTTIWEPCYGRGAIAREFSNNGYKVITSDIVSYDQNNSPDFIGDFLSIKSPPIEDTRNLVIVTNPPFGKKYPQKFINHATDNLKIKSYWLLRLAFLEGISDERDIALNSCNVVYVFKNRLPRMHRDGWSKNKASSTVAYAWFSCDPNHFAGCGISLRRIAWSRKWIENQPFTY